jgi:hypothetical protein
MRSEPGRGSYERLFAQCSRLMQAITALPQPVIARVHGVATAAGCQLVATCDLAVAAENARFATPGVNIGLFCSTPMVALSRNVGRKQAMEMLMWGELIDAPTAQRFGLVNRVVPASSLDEEVARITEAIVGKSPLTLRIGREAFYRQLERPAAEAYDYAGRVMVANMLAPTPRGASTPFSRSGACLDRDLSGRRAMGTQALLPTRTGSTIRCPETLTPDLISSGPPSCPHQLARKVGFRRRLHLIQAGSRYEYAFQTLAEIKYREWRNYDPEDTIRFYALRLHEAGMIEPSPNQIIAQGTDWRFQKEVKAGTQCRDTAT